jgi:hypothetical protein
MTAEMTNETFMMTAGKRDGRSGTMLDHPLHMVVVKGFGIKPIMLLTNCAVPIRRKERACWYR